MEIPTDLPKNVIRLDLSGNNIKHIPVEAFQNCTDVREILLDRNVIEEIDKEVFINMAHLDVLGLAGNQLSHLAPDTFVEAQSLRRLVLSENPLVIPDEGPFLEQEDLEELELARCNLTELTRDAFTGMNGLKWLNLAGNEFDEVSWHYTCICFAAFSHICLPGYQYRRVRTVGESPAVKHATTFGGRRSRTMRCGEINRRG